MMTHDLKGTAPLNSVIFESSESTTLAAVTTVTASETAAAAWLCYGGKHVS